MPILTAKQEIERAKGAAAERRWLMARIREINKVYGGKDVILGVLLDELKARDRNSK